MSRHALRTFFTRVLPIALPLSTGCGSGHNCGGLVEEKNPVTADRIPDGGITDAGCGAFCSSYFVNVVTCSVTDGGYPVASTVAVTCRGYQYCSGGRRPDGFSPTEHGHLARLAELEAASVHAFRILAAELHEHGAPSSLIDAARRSARDEARHARLMGALAGVRPKLVKPIRRTRSLEAIAVENVVEGCVRETFGAALAQLEARTHADERVRRAMASIYPDEERHAELAHTVDRWIRPRLSRAARRRVDDARRLALDELREETPTLRPLVHALARTLA